MVFRVKFNSLSPRAVHQRKNFAPCSSEYRAHLGIQFIRLDEILGREGGIGFGFQSDGL